MGSTQRRLLDAVKRRGRLTLAEACEALELSLGTVREHMHALAAEGLVTQVGTRREGPGRPELVFALTDRGHAAYPQRADQVLSELIAHLTKTGHGHVLRRFLEERMAARLKEAGPRMAGLRGRRRVEEVARVMTEEGFMAVVEGTSRTYRLRLCHCPLKTLVAKTQVPCRLEVAFIEGLLGQSLERTSFMPSGDTSCSYAVAPKRRRRTR